MLVEFGAASPLPCSTVEPRVAPNLVYHVVGQAILALNKVRHEIQGYRTPRPFPVTEIDRAIDYDFDVVRKWLDAYRTYTGRDVSLDGKQVLELGPGADLGIGVIVLASGGGSYHAIDVNDLVKTAPAELYDALFARLERDGQEVAPARAALREAVSGVRGRLDYVCRSDFDIRVFAGAGINLVVSHAAFEHFDDVDAVISQTSAVVVPGAVFVAEIDLQTHTRKIRDADPLNIYRYSGRMYRLFKFLGSPNRIRPYQYEASLSRHGWRDIRMYATIVVSEDHLARVRPSLNACFQDDLNEMQVLDMVVCATKA